MNEYLELYKEVFAVEREKARTYANLWTILITATGAILGFYFGSPQKLVVLLIPPLFLIWCVFAYFNYLYLKTVRKFLSNLETKINFEEDFQWFSKKFNKEITEKSAKMLGIVIAIGLSLGFLYILYLCYNELKQKSFSFVVIYVLGLIIIALALLICKMWIINRNKS